MPFDIPSALKSIAKGLVAEAAPLVAKGVLVELLRGKTIEEACQWVDENKRLWDSIDPQRQSRIKEFTGKHFSPADKLDWMNVDWALEAMREEEPALASLFLGWRKGKNWLARQVEIFKKEIRE